MAVKRNLRQIAPSAPGYAAGNAAIKALEYARSGFGDFTDAMDERALNAALAQALSGGPVDQGSNIDQTKLYDAIYSQKINESNLSSKRSERLTQAVTRRGLTATADKQEFDADPERMARLFDLSVGESEADIEASNTTTAANQLKISGLKAANIQQERNQEAVSGIRSAWGEEYQKNYGKETEYFDSIKQVLIAEGSTEDEANELLRTVYDPQARLSAQVATDNNLRAFTTKMMAKYPDVPMSVLGGTKPFQTISAVDTEALRRAGLRDADNEKIFNYQQTSISKAKQGDYTGILQNADGQMVLAKNSIQGEGNTVPNTLSGISNTLEEMGYSPVENNAELDKAKQVVNLLGKNKAYFKSIVQNATKTPASLNPFANKAPEINWDAAVSAAKLQQKSFAGFANKTIAGNTLNGIGAASMKDALALLESKSADKKFVDENKTNPNLASENTIANLNAFTPAATLTQAEDNAALLANSLQAAKSVINDLDLDALKNNKVLVNRLKSQIDMIESGKKLMPIAVSGLMAGGYIPPQEINLQPKDKAEELLKFNQLYKELQRKTGARKEKENKKTMERRTDEIFQARLGNQ